MKAIISGAKGNLGKHIIVNANFEVISLGRDNWNDLRKYSYGKDDVFVHCAYDLKNSLKEKPDEVIDSNVLSTMKALRVVKENGIGKLIFISSCSVYGYSSKSREDLECSPVTVNGLSKYLCEKVIEEFCLSNKIEFLILRVFNTYAGDDNFSVVSKIIKAAKNKSCIVLNNNGQAERDYIHIDDVAKVVCYYCGNSSRYNIVNVGTGQTIRIKDILQAVEKKFGSINKENKLNQEEVDYSRANISRLSSEMNIKFKDIFEYINKLN